MSEEQKPRVQSAARTVEILKCVANAPPGGISAKDISAQLGLPRQVVYHIAHTLMETGMLRKVDSSRYGLGIGVGPLAVGFRRQLSGMVSSSQMAEDVAAETGEAAYIVGWLDDEIVVLATARGHATVRAAEINLGTTGNAHARASGKLLLSMLAEDRLGAYVDRHPLTQLTPNTIVSRNLLLAELRRVREERVSVDREEFALGLTCLAVPIEETPSSLCLGLSAPTERVRQNYDRYVATLRRIATTRPGHAGVRGDRGH